MKTEKQYQIKTAFKELDKFSLSAGTASFIKSLKKEFARNKDLSDKQQKALFEIRDSIQVEASCEK